MNVGNSAPYSCRKAAKRSFSWYNYTMESNEHPDRLIVRKMTLAEESDNHPMVGATPAERLMMMWRIAQDCWTFVPGHDAKREFQRHVVRIERRGR